MMCVRSPPARITARHTRFRHAHENGGSPAPTALPARTQALSETESSTLVSAVAAMQAGGGWPPSQLRLFERLLRWPPSYLYPVLDTLRLAVLSPGIAAEIAAEALQEGSTASLVGLLALHPLRAVQDSRPSYQESRRESQEVNQMMGLRFWCNLLAHAPAAQLAPLVPAALEAAAQADCHECRRPATRLALSTLLLDLAVLLQRQRAGPDDKTMLVCALQQLLTTPQPDAEVRAPPRTAPHRAAPAAPPRAPKCCRSRAQPDAPRSVAACRRCAHGGCSRWARCSRATRPPHASAPTSTLRAWWRSSRTDPAQRAGRARSPPRCSPSLRARPRQPTRWPQMPRSTAEPRCARRSACSLSLSGVLAHREVFIGGLCLLPLSGA